MNKISVIIPVYNVEKYIERCLKSIQEQTIEENIEVLIINDGSKENEEEIIEQYVNKNSNFKYVKKENGGQASARNLGIKLAEAEYILFLDSDDYLEKDALEKMYNAAVEDKADIVLCDGSFVYSDDCKEYFKTNVGYTNDPKANYLINACSPCFKMINRKILLNQKTKFLEGRIYEDLASVGTYLLYAKKIVYIEEPLYNYTVREGSTMNKIKFDEKLVDIFYSIENLRRIFVDADRYEMYKKEFEYIYIMRLLHDASLRFFEFPEGRKYNVKIADIMKEEYPKWRKNCYYKKQSLKYKIVCNLFANKSFYLLSLLLKKGNK